MTDVNYVDDNGYYEVRDPADLTLPLYGASFSEATIRFFKSMFRYRGRASQSEYWWPWLLQLIALAVGIAFAIVSGATEADAPAVSGVFVGLAIAAFAFGFLVVGVGFIALSVRRLHDANASGWWYLLIIVAGIVPCIGAVGPIIIGVLSTNPAGARFDAGELPHDRLFE